MKVLMMTDMEGVAGVVSFAPQSYPAGKYYEEARALLTGEVNAAIEGLLQSGVEDILVIDGHGAGGIVYEQLLPPARLVHGRPAAPNEVLRRHLKGYDALMVVGQHAMAGIADANQNHTQASLAVDHYKLNGKLIGEIAQFALYFGALGMPLIFLSGDEAACREAEVLVPTVKTAAVKTGLSRNAAISLPLVEARRRIREGAAEAVRRQRANPAPPLKWNPPFVLEKRFFHTDTADGAASQPGWERIDGQTVQCRSNDILDVIFK